MLKWILQMIKRLFNYGWEKLMTYLKQVDKDYHLTQYLKDNTYTPKGTGPPKVKNFFSFLRAGLSELKNRIFRSSSPRPAAVPLVINMPRNYMRGRRQRFDRLRM